MIVTRKYLRKNPNHVFVFGDNLLRRGRGGAAALRDEHNTYGFITKKAPNNRDSSFYRLEDYKPVLESEVEELVSTAQANPNKTYLVSRVGSGLANKYNIWDLVKPRLEQLQEPNIRLLW